MNRNRNHVLAIASISIGLLVATPARAGTYSKVDQSTWQQGVTGLPSYVNMYIYLPTTLATKPPIVVGIHHCQGSASSSHSEMASLESIADKNGFIMIYPEATGENCWDAGSKRSLKHDGGGDTQGIAQMVRYALSKYSGDAGRVYSVGGSSGGIMTEAMLGVYPDIFMAGVSLMGVPCGCWAESYNDTTGTGSTAQWSGPCASGTVTKTGQQWGDLVRSYFPGYSGHRPRLQHWHGTADTTLNYKNMAEDIKEWTNLLGLSETPTATENNTPSSGTTHQYWKNSCYTVYETFSMAGVAHAVPFNGSQIAAYFGLDKAGGQDPETAVCPDAVPGGGGTGTGGATGAGGATGVGGTGGTRDGGLGGRDGGGDVSTSGAGGAQATGGSSAGGDQGTGGAGGGGISGKGGASASGGGVGNGGSTGGATSGKGGSGSGGADGTGGSVGSGGSSAAGGAGSGGTPGNGGSTQQGGGSGGSAGTGGGGSSGDCNCAVGGRGGHLGSTMTALLFATLGLLARRRRRASR